MAPNRDVVKPEFVPPAIKHGLIEAQDSFSRDAVGGGRKLCQALVDQDSLRLIDPCQQVP